LVLLLSSPYCLAPFHRRPDLRIPDRWETLPNSGIFEWWWAVHALGTGRNIFRRHSMVSICTLWILHNWNCKCL